MAYTCTLYTNSSPGNYLNKSLSKLGDFSCNFKNRIDVENPEVYVAAGASYTLANYMYIPFFGRYYFCHGEVGTSGTINFVCESDPLMSFKAGILAAPAVIARNPWKYDKYLPDNRMPIESRAVRGTFKFPTTTHFNGTNNSYILMTVGSGEGDS